LNFTSFERTLSVQQFEQKMQAAVAAVPGPGRCGEIHAGVATWGWRARSTQPVPHRKVVLARRGAWPKRTRARLDALRASR
jgi:hypothetical protein